MNALLEAAASLDVRFVLFAMIAVLDLWSCTLVWFATAPTRDKILWTGIIVVCPFVGCFFWFVFGPKWRPKS